LLDPPKGVSVPPVIRSPFACTWAAICRNAAMICDGSLC
jgi:hypothetical protein